MAWNRTPRRDPIKDGSLFSVRSPSRKDRATFQKETTQTHGIQGGIQGRQAHDWAMSPPARQQWTDEQGDARTMGQASPYVDCRPPSSADGHRRNAWGSPTSRSANAQSHQNSPIDKEKWAQSGAAMAIRANFENLVRSSPLPKVLQQNQNVASPVHRASIPLIRGETAFPKPVRASLVPPPRFMDEPKPIEVVQSQMSVGNGHGNANGNANGNVVTKLTLLNEWWIEPVLGPGKTKFRLLGTEHSAFTEDTFRVMVDIQERLSSNLLLVEDNRKVKLIGKPNKTKMDALYAEVTSIFSEGIPHDWEAILNTSRKNKNVHSSTNKGKMEVVHDEKQSEPSEHGEIKSFEDLDEMDQDEEDAPTVHDNDDNTPKPSVEKHTDTFKEKLSPSKRSQRNPKPIQRFGTIPDDDACFCGAATLMRDGSKQRKLEKGKRLGGTPSPSKTSVTYKRLKRFEEQSSKNNDDGNKLDTKKGNSEVINYSKDKRKSSGHNSNNAKDKANVKVKMESKSSPRKLRPATKTRREMTKESYVSPSTSKSKKVAVQQGIDTFKVSKRGRRIVPKLEFWKNETINYDLRTGEAVGITVDDRKDEIPKYENSTKIRSPNRTSSKKSRKAKDTTVKRSSDTNGAMKVKIEKIDRKVEDDCISQDYSETESLLSGHSSEFESVASDGWSLEQINALNIAQLQVNPTCRNFWQEVAKHVPGKSADECFTKHFQKHPTPVTQKTKSLTGMLGNEVELKDTIVSNAPSAAVRKQMKHMRWKRLKKFEQADRDMGEKGKRSIREERRREAGSVDDSNFRRSSRLKPYGEATEKQHVRPASKDDDDLDITQALVGKSKPKTLAAAIVSALAEAQPDVEDEEEDEDFYFTDDM